MCYATSICLEQMRYRNNSNYKQDTEIRKKAYVSQAVLDELKRIIADAEVCCIYIHKARGSGSGWQGRLQERDLTNAQQRQMKEGGRRTPQQECCARPQPS